MRELNKKDIDELFYQLKLPKKNIKPKSFEVWEVPPIKKMYDYIQALIS